MYKRSAPPAFIVGHFVVFAVCLSGTHLGTRCPGFQLYIFSLGLVYSSFAYFATHK